MSQCKRAREHLLVGVDDRMPEAWLTEHLRACEECRAEAERLRREAGQLRSAAQAVPLPDPNLLWARVEAQLPRRQSVPWRLPAALAPAALLLALWLGPRIPGGQVSRPAEPIASAALPAQPSAPAAMAAVKPPTREVTVVNGGAYPLSATRPARHVVRRMFRQRSSSPARVTAPLPVAVATRIEQQPRQPVPVPAPVQPVILPPAPDEAPVAAVVVVRAPAPSTGIAQMPAEGVATFCRSESTDPVSGATTRLAVRRETDAAGTLRQVTIRYEVQSPSAGEKAGEI